MGKDGTRSPEIMIESLNTPMKEWEKTNYLVSLVLIQTTSHHLVLLCWDLFGGGEGGEGGGVLLSLLLLLLQSKKEKRERKKTHTGLIAVAMDLTRICPGPGFGFSTSLTTSKGAFGSFVMAAFILIYLLLF